MSHLPENITATNEGWAWSKPGCRTYTIRADTDGFVAFNSRDEVVHWHHSLFALAERLDLIESMSQVRSGAVLPSRSDACLPPLSWLDRLRDWWRRTRL
jgi:hypothetical protein